MGCKTKINLFFKFLDLIKIYEKIKSIIKDAKKI